MSDDEVVIGHIGSTSVRDGDDIVNLQPGHTSSSSSSTTSGPIRTMEEGPNGRSLYIVQCDSK